MTDDERRELAKRYKDFIIGAREASSRHDYSFVPQMQELQSEIVRAFIKTYGDYKVVYPGAED